MSDRAARQSRKHLGSSSEMDWRLCLWFLFSLALAFALVPNLRRNLNDWDESDVLRENRRPQARPEEEGSGSLWAYLSAGATGTVISGSDGSMVRGEDPPSDADLVEGTRRGEPQAFEKLVRRHIGPAHALALSIARSSDLADDICQDAFLSALRNIEQCRHPERFRAWFLTIVRNRALSLRASEALKSGVSLEGSGQFASDDDPQRNVEEKEFLEELQEALDQIAGLNRDVFILHDMDGWDHTEISRKLGISRIASRVHLHHARRRLKAVFEGYPMTEV